MRGFAVLLLLAAFWGAPSIAAAQDTTAPAAEEDPAAAATDDDAAGEEDEDEDAAAEEEAPAEQTASAEDPAASVLKVFETHCARCHQDGKLVGREKPAGGFGFILDLEALARNPEYIQPGNPSGSLVYTNIVNGSMPKDMDYVTVFGPSADETKAVKAWIESLTASTEATVASRSFIEDEDTVRLMSDDLSKLSDFERPRVRYFTLTHLYNAGDTDEEMEVYRQALAKLVNSLSVESGIVVHNAIRVVPNGADLRFARATPARFIARFCVDDFVFSPGRIEPRKNQLQLIRPSATAIL